MKKPIGALLVVAMLAALTVPAVALAQPGRGRSQQSMTQGGKVTMVPAAEKHADVAKRADNAARKATHRAEKATRRAQRSALRASRDASKTMDADETTESVEPSGSVEPTRSVDATASASHGRLRSFDRITRNIEKSIAKIEAGQKSQIPPGLMRVWLKFAEWLGIDPSTMPAVPTKSTVEPTATVEPTVTIEPTVTVTP